MGEGIISPSSPQVLSGDDITFTFTPASGYDVEDVIIDGESLGKLSDYTFEDVREDHTVRVIFDGEAIKVTDIHLNKASIAMKKGATEKLIVTVEPSNATKDMVDWSSSDENIVTVSKEGLITAISEGEAIITVSATDGSGIKAECLVTVKDSEEASNIIDISNAIVNLSQTEFIYDGQEKKPEFIVTLNGTPLGENNYDYHYENNVNVGTASLIIEGKGNYSGRKVQNYTIREAYSATSDRGSIENGTDKNIDTTRNTDSSQSSSSSSQSQNSMNDQTTNNSGAIGNNNSAIVQNGGSDSSSTMNPSNYTGSSSGSSLGNYINGAGNSLNSFGGNFGSMGGSSGSGGSGGSGGGGSSSSSNSIGRSGDGTSFDKGDSKISGSGARRAVYTKIAQKSVRYDEARAGVTAKVVKVPKEVRIDGDIYKVTAIATDAFLMNTSLEKVVVGKNVKKIKSEAFELSPKLKTLTLNTKKLTKKGIKNSLKGSNIINVNVPRSKIEEYKKIFTKENIGSKKEVKVKEKKKKKK